MDNHILILNFNEEIIFSLRKKEIIIRKSDFNNFPLIKSIVSRHNSLNRFEVTTNQLLSQIHITEEILNFPLVVKIKGMGDFKELIRKFPVLKKLKARFFFSTDQADTFQNIQILSSLGVDTGFYFGTKPVNWQQATDLLTYSFYAKTKHAYIQPFYYLSENYQATKMNNFNDVYYNNPEKFLHIDDNGKIYLTREDISKGENIEIDLKDIDRINETNEYKEKIHAWQEHFIVGTKCAYCKAWRVCLGHFSNEDKDDCKIFFTELMDAIDYSKINK